MTNQSTDNDTAAIQAAILRRMYRHMADALDRAAQRDIKGSRDWRDLQNTGDRYADR